MKTNCILAQRCANLYLRDMRSILLASWTKFVAGCCALVFKKCLAVVNKMKESNEISFFFRFQERNVTALILVERHPFTFVKWSGYIGYNLNYFASQGEFIKSSQG